MSEIDEFFQVETAMQEQEVEASYSKREFLVDIINQGKADKLSGKTSWTVGRNQKSFGEGRGKVVSRVSPS